MNEGSKVRKTKPKVLMYKCALYASRRANMLTLLKPMPPSSSIHIKPKTKSFLLSHLMDVLKEAGVPVDWDNRTIAASGKRFGSKFKLTQGKRSILFTAEVLYFQLIHKAEGIDLKYAPLSYHLGFPGGLGDVFTRNRDSVVEALKLHW